MKNAKKYTTAKLEAICPINGTAFTWEFRRENGNGHLECRRVHDGFQGHASGFIFASRKEEALAKGLTFA